MTPKRLLSLSLFVLATAVALYSFIPAGSALSAPYSKSDTNITRFGGSTTTNNPAGQDNTGRSMTYRYFTPTDGTGADTVTLFPHASSTIIQYTAVDSVAFQVTNLTQSYIGDQITFLILNSSGSGHQVKFIGTGWQFGSGGAAMALTSAKRASIKFEFEGTYWLELGRLAQ